MFSSLKKLGIGACSQYTSPSQMRNGRAAQKEQGAMLLQRLPLGLASMPELEEFHVHWYNIGSLSIPKPQEMQPEWSICLSR